MTLAWYSKLATTNALTPFTPGVAGGIVAKTFPFRAAQFSELAPVAVYIANDYVYVQYRYMYKTIVADSVQSIAMCRIHA